MKVERLFFPPADHTAQIILKAVRRNKIAAIKTTKKETIETCMDAIEESLVELSFVKHNVLQPRNLPTADKFKKTGTTCLEKRGQ